MPAATLNRIDPTGLWYIDLGASFAQGLLGITGGVIISDTGVYTYLGRAYGLEVGVSATVSPCGVTAGRTRALEGGYSWYAGQVGLDFAGGFFAQGGGGFGLGGAYVDYNISPLISW